MITLLSASFFIFISCNKAIFNDNNANINTYPLQASIDNLYNQFRNAILDSYKLELYERNQDNYTCINHDEIGLLNISNDSLMISSSYYFGNESLTIVWPDQNYVTTNRLVCDEREKSEFWETSMRSLYEDDYLIKNTYLSDNLSFSEWLPVRLVFITYGTYIAYIRQGINERHWTDNVDLEFILNNMEEMWCVTIKQLEDYDLEITYEYDALNNDLNCKYYYEEVLIYETSNYLMNRNLELNGEDKIEGTIIY